ncbi:MAG: sensor histidine kinase [Actinomycetota bacterium]
MRARTTTGAVVVVGAALLIASVALLVLMQNAMEGNIKDAARLRARDIVSALEGGSSPSAVTVGSDDDTLVQVVDPTGRVLASTALFEGHAPLADLRPGDSEIVPEIPGDDDPFVTVAEVADINGGRVTVLVARNLDVVRETGAVVTRILLLGVPLLLLVVGLTTWAMAGRALAPVESIRSGVAEISATELHRRVITPSGDDEIARLAQTMNDMLTRLDEAHKRQQRLVSDASHELRNPIATIGHHAEVALAHPESTTLETLASEVLAENVRLQSLAEDLLLLARADERTLELSFRPLDLDDLVLEEARRLGLTTQLRIDTSGVSAARTNGDRAGLQRVVRNLADNAARHASSAVRFSVREQDGQIVLEVDDDGTGVPVESRGIVFERFTRLDDARDRAHGGAGLGLAIVAEIVAAHGGSATVSDAPLGGARFEVILPQSSAA